MKAWELLNEKAVKSAWIVDIRHTRSSNTITMSLSDGKQYSILGITRKIFEEWTNSVSKGQYFHEYIKPYHQITRI
jgi:hypothetical protein